MNARNFVIGTLSALVLAASLAGCGSSPAATDPSELDSGASDPGYGAAPAAPGGAYGAPATGPAAMAGTSAYGAPTAAAATAPANLQDLTADITTKKGGLFHKFSCTVEVTNPNSVARTGTITVTFTHNGKPESGSPPQTQQVSVPANGTMTYDFKDNKYHLLKEDATVSITTDPAH